MKTTEFDHDGPRQIVPKLIVLALTLTVTAVGPRCALAQAPSAGSWRELADMPVPRWEAGTVVLDDRLYVFGGYTRGTRSSRRAPSVASNQLMRSIGWVSLLAGPPCTRAHWARVSSWRARK